MDWFTHFLRLSQWIDIVNQLEKQNSISIIFPFFQLNSHLHYTIYLAALKFVIWSLAQISMIKRHSQLELNIPLMWDSSYWYFDNTSLTNFWWIRLFLDLTILKGRLLRSIHLAVMFRENYIGLAHSRRWLCFPSLNIQFLLPNQQSIIFNLSNITIFFKTFE